MALTTEDRQRVANGLMRWWSNIWETVSGSSSLILAVVGAVDDWADASQASYNATLPEPFRSTATAAQKTLVLVVVIVARLNMGWLRRLVGEVD